MLAKEISLLHSISHFDFEDWSSQSGPLNHVLSQERGMKKYLWPSQWGTRGKLLEAQDLGPSFSTSVLPRFKGSNYIALSYWEKKLWNLLKRKTKSFTIGKDKKNRTRQGRCNDWTYCKFTKKIAIGLLKVSWIKGNVKTDRWYEKNDRTVKNTRNKKHSNERIISW